MIGKDQFKTLMEVASCPPSQVATKAQSLRNRSLQCAELASTCVTQNGKQVLLGLAADLQKEAERLQEAVELIRLISRDGAAAGTPLGAADRADAAEQGRP